MKLKINWNGVATTVVGGVIAAAVVAIIARNTNIMNKEKSEKSKPEQGDDLPYFWWL